MVPMYRCFSLINWILAAVSLVGLSSYSVSTSVANQRSGFGLTVILGAFFADLVRGVICHNAGHGMHSF